MAAYEVLLLNTAIPQIQAAQAGDTYVVPRDIAFTSNLTLSGGTANGVAYLNGSKVLTTGSALTFDGTSLGLGAAIPIAVGGYSVIRINGSTGGLLELTSGNTRVLQIQSDGASAGAQITTVNNGSNPPLIFGVNSSEQMRLTSSGLEVKQSQLIGYSSYAGIGTNGLAVAGNLGIGTSSPANKLSVVGTGTTTLSFIQNSSSFAGGTNFTQPHLSINSGNDTTGNVTRLAISVGTGAQVYLDALMESGVNVYSSLLFRTRGADGVGERMRLDSSGNLGLGQVPAVRKFEINAIPAAVSQLNGIRLQMNGVATSASEFLVGTDSGGVPFSSLRTGNDGNSYMTFFTGSGPTERARITSTGEFQWKPDGTTQAMTLDASGNLAVGRTSAIGGARVSAETATGSPTYAAYLPTTGTETAFLFVNPNGTVGSITTNGSATLYNVTSDQRLKENVQDAAPASALIDSLQVRQFDWKSDNFHQRYGFVAQELVTVAPEAVHQPTNPDEMMAVDYSKLVPMLVKEIQSLRQRVAQLESKGA